MTHWRLVNTHRLPKRPLPAFLVLKTKGTVTLNLGEKVGHLHGVLISLIDHFEPGDIIETPEGRFPYYKLPKLLPRN